MSSLWIIRIRQGSPLVLSLDITEGAQRKVIPTEDPEWLQDRRLWPS